jgi:hypothetical protein
MPMALASSRWLYSGCCSSVLSRLPPYRVTIGWREVAFRAEHLTQFCVKTQQKNDKNLNIYLLE